MIFRAINKVIRPFNYEIRRRSAAKAGIFPEDFDDFEKGLVKNRLSDFH